MLRRWGKIGAGLRGWLREIDAGLGFRGDLDLLLLDVVLISEFFLGFSFRGLAVDRGLFDCMPFRRSFMPA